MPILLPFTVMLNEKTDRFADKREVGGGREGRGRGGGKEVEELKKATRQIGGTDSGTTDPVLAE